MRNSHNIETMDSVAMGRSWTMCLQEPIVPNPTLNQMPMALRHVSFGTYFRTKEWMLYSML